MDRLGPPPSEMRTLREEDILQSRLHLLILMAKAYLKNYQLGSYRTEAIKNNVGKLSDSIGNWESYIRHFCAVGGGQRHIHLDHILFQRVKLLSIMAKSFAEGNPMGFHRKMALQNNIDYICDSLKFKNKPDQTQILSVA